MNIRWRLSLSLIQFAIIVGLCFYITGDLFTKETWFIAGLLSVIINPQLLEPYYSRPTDVIVNTIFFGLLALNTPKTTTVFGWSIFGTIFAVAAILATLALFLGAGRRNSKYSGIANSFRSLSQLASARIIYSVVFVLAAMEEFPTNQSDFWAIIAVWVTILVLGRVNWQSLWSVSRDGEALCIVEGMVGPSSLLISAPDLPATGKPVIIRSSKVNTDGVMIHRIRRVADTWGQIHVPDSQACESVVTGQTISVSESPDGLLTPVGSVDQGSTDKTLKFTSVQSMEIGDVVVVSQNAPNPPILYQLSSAYIDRRDVKGGSHLLVNASANQLGVFNYNAMRMSAHRWVPPPGARVLPSSAIDLEGRISIPENNIEIGKVIGTDIPITLDCRIAAEGHLAILGMTKMGKSTFATRLARELSQDRWVTILDQTGEYVSKKGLTPYDSNTDLKKPGLSVFEPKHGEVAADRALAFLEYLIKEAIAEYKTGTPRSRVVIIDEAHQFIPEPAGLGFNAPGRDSAFKIGLLMMQIRKYGLSVILISQRTAVVAKSALSQCENLICFRSVDQTGLDYLEAIAGSNIRSMLLW
ncbi:helicase HerA domain-containing protein [Puniceicoccus vermicola]|uniref:ATP-binding protein n=1 Tax=Puniceicoccus vermicola TaxID=388746 RepID=A0A7X1E4E3_9BACT|nr:DUF87 domain-containing protein [Puniceicoccus vermicola]MBC2601893.1 ATP-binding protein [Puniceicoccus vermicola]